MKHQCTDEKYEPVYPSVWSEGTSVTNVPPTARPLSFCLAKNTNTALKPCRPGLNSETIMTFFHRAACCRRHLTLYYSIWLSKGHCNYTSANVKDFPLCTQVHTAVSATKGLADLVSQSADEDITLNSTLINLLPLQ